MPASMCMCVQACMSKCTHMCTKGAKLNQIKSNAPDVEAGALQGQAASLSPSFRDFPQSSYQESAGNFKCSDSLIKVHFSAATFCAKIKFLN